METYDIKKEKDENSINGKLIKIDKNKGFNFDYLLFIPNSIKKETTLIIEGSNISSGSSNTIEEANKEMLKEGIDPSLPIYVIATELGLPILYPLFPRIHNGEETIYNHMLSSNSLDSNTKMIKELGLERVDLQLIEMLKDAKNKLKKFNIQIDDKYIIDGFSASAKFANRFTLLHPELIKLCIAGGISGVLTLPLKEYNNEKLLYPVGLGNFDTNIEEFKKVRQIYYMGDQDITNEPYKFNENNESCYPGIIKTNELIQMSKIFGDHAINDRWPKIQELYKDLGINAVFKTYEGYAHNPWPAKEDIKEEIKNILGMDKDLKL